METLPHEILRYYITDYRDCVALRCTCKWYRDFTMHGMLVIEDTADRIVNEKYQYSCLETFIVYGKFIKHIRSRDAMRLYLVLSSCCGYEYTMWLCSQNTAAVGREIARLISMGYNYYVALGPRTAVYIKTSELVNNPFTPLDGYNDTLWCE